LCASDVSAPDCLSVQVHDLAKVALQAGNPIEAAACPAHRKVEGSVPDVFHQNALAELRVRSQTVQYHVNRGEDRQTVLAFRKFMVNRQPERCFRSLKPFHFSLDSLDKLPVVKFDRFARLPEHLLRQSVALCHHAGEVWGRRVDYAAVNERLHNRRLRPFAHNPAKNARIQSGIAPFVRVAVCGLFDDRVDKPPRIVGATAEPRGQQFLRVKTGRHLENRRIGP
jgi:hypothetical protein